MHYFPASLSHKPAPGVDPGFEMGGGGVCDQNVRVSAQKFFPPTLSSPQPRFGHLGIVTLSSQLASTSMRWLKITILRLFVATAVNIKNKEIVLPLPFKFSPVFQIDFLG